MDHKTYISVDKDGWTGGIQISIDVERKDGGGHGYRISGPKFNGSSKRIARALIGISEAREIRSYMDRIIAEQEAA